MNGSLEDIYQIDLDSIKTYFQMLFQLNYILKIQMGVQNERFERDGNEKEMVIQPSESLILFHFRLILVSK